LNILIIEGVVTYFTGTVKRDLNTIKWPQFGNFK